MQTPIRKYVQYIADLLSSRLVRWEMWDEERRTRNRQLKMERTEQLIGPDTGLCHNFGDLPFWDWKQVRNKLDGEKRELEQLQQERPRTEQGTSPNPQIRKRICEAEKRVAVYEMAYAASLADVERLRPGQETVERDLRARAADLTIGILDAQQEVEEIRGWIGRLPEGADQARKLAQERVDRWEDAITHMMKSRQCCVESMDKWTREPED